MKSLFPAFLKLDGRSVLVVGAGKVGEQKIESLLCTGANISVVALEASPAVQEWALEGALTLHQRAFQPADLAGVFLAIVATSSRELNEFAYREAQRQRVLCNVVDVPELCDFFYPAVVRRGDLQIAVSTSGQSPSLAQRIRQQLEEQFGPNYGPWVEELGHTRRLVLASDLPAEVKRELLHSLASRAAFEEQLRAASRELRATKNAFVPEVSSSPFGIQARTSEEYESYEREQQAHDLVARSSELAARSSQEIA